ncbi:MAG: hypothetical protein WBZ48_06775 [Bacteroidota bacterium]
MYERLLKQTERYLGNRKEIVVPVNQVWSAMVKEGKTNNFEVPSLMADFECLLEGDKRFEFISEKSSSKGRDPYADDYFEDEETEKLGFSENQKVKLRRIPFPSVGSNVESIDALDAAISMEELGEEFGDSALYESGSASPIRGIPSNQKPSVAEKKKAAIAITRKNQKTSGKAAKKMSKRKFSAKNRKK